MIPITICVVISGVITLVITTAIMHKRPYMCYLLMVIIPLITLIFALKIFPITLPAQPKNATERAEIHIRDGEFTNAINILEQLVETEEKEEKNIIQLGRAYFAKGLLHAEHNEKEQALQHLRKAQTIFPKDSPYTFDLQGFIDKIELMDMNK